MAHGNTLIFRLSPAIVDDLQQIFSCYPTIQKVLIFGARSTRDYKDGSNIDLAVFAPNMSDHTVTQARHQYIAAGLRVIPPKINRVKQ